jgi:Sulfotransferase family
VSTAGSAPPRPTVRVVYLGGVGRSGSSLVARLLDETPDAAAVGEVVRLWERGVTDDERCSCGRRFWECPFWRAVGDAGFGGWERLDAGQVVRLKMRTGRLRHVPRLVAPWSPPGSRRRATEYAGFYARLYAAVQEVTGRPVVVDASKNVSLAAVLRWSPDVDLRVVHLVRDVPGVAYSWGKRIGRPETDGATSMPTYPPWLVGVWWATENALFHALSARGVPTLRLRYEDLAGDPAGALDAIRRFAGLSPVDYPFLRERTGHLGLGHTLGGNPMRFDSGQVQVGVDDAWRTGLDRRSRRVVSALGFPLRAAYGYVGRGRG